MDNIKLTPEGLAIFPPAATPAPASPAAKPGFAGPVEIWTDGGCRPNPGPGGWAAILRHGAKTLELSGFHPNTTNNRMEMRAAIAGLEALNRPCRVTMFVDSEYVQLGMTIRLPRWQANGWKTGKGKPVENREIWQRLAAAAARHDVEWRWTRGHAGDPLNERADQLATLAREKAPQHVYRFWHSVSFSGT